MKLKYIFTALVAALTLAVGCEDNIESYLDEVKVSSSYVAIPAEGGSQTITVNAKDEWSFGDIPEWVTVTPTSGVAGETEVTFKAEATTSTNTAMLYLNCDGKSQIINVLQMTEKIELSVTPLKEFLAAEVGSTVYRIAGTITNIQEISASYKNATMTISDDEGYSVYLYRFGPPSGQNIEDLGMEVGDFLTVEGKRGEYSGSPQMAQGGVFVSLVKSLIKVDSVTVRNPETNEFELYNEPLPLEGEQFKVHLTCKGDGISVVVPDDSKSWISVNAIETSGNNATVVFNAAANPLGDRATALTFSTVSGGKTYSAQAELEQKGAIIETTIDKLLVAEDGATQYRTTGYITQDKGSEYGNIYIKDATGEIYVYGVLDDKGQTKQWKNMGINAGDIVTVVGPKASYNGSPQLKNVTIENHIAVKDISLADFRTLNDDKSAYYRISGKVAKSTEANTKFDLDTYGNFALTDGTTEVYVYGVRTGWGGAKAQFGTLGIKEGDELTIVCYKTSYKDLVEADGCFYVSHKAGGTVEPEDPKPGVDDYSIDLNYTKGTNAYDDCLATINGKENVKVLKIGTSSKTGDITVTVPAGSSKVSFYAVAWKSSPTTLEFSVDGKSVGTVPVAANDGATGNSPFTLTVTDTDKYEVNLGSALAADTDVKITTASGAKTRALFFGVKALKD